MALTDFPTALLDHLAQVEMALDVLDEAVLRQAIQEVPRECLRYPVTSMGRSKRGTCELVPAALVPRDQSWFRHPEMQSRVDKAEADLAEGRLQVTRTAAQAQALLDAFKGRRHRPRR